MKFDMKKPCANCPFRKHERAVRLHSARVVEIMASEGMFPCHKTVDYSHDDDGRETPDTQACVGFMVLAHKLGRPNQMMRIAKRLGLIKLRVLEDPANHQAVVDRPSEIIEKRKGSPCPTRTR